VEDQDLKTYIRLRGKKASGIPLNGQESMALGQLSMIYGDKDTKDLPDGYTKNLYSDSTLDRKKANAVIDQFEQKDRERQQLKQDFLRQMSEQNPPVEAKPVPVKPRQGDKAAPLLWDDQANAPSMEQNDMDKIEAKKAALKRYLGE